VYVQTRRECAELVRFLLDNKVKADMYHAGLTPDERAKKQESWKSNQTRVMVATNAFGMGIDKPDVRFVIHKEAPQSLEAYYQEAGRAGRDESKAYAVLLYNEADRFKMQRKLELSFPSVEEIKRVYNHLGSYYHIAYGAGAGVSFDLDLGGFCAQFKLDVIKTLNSLKFLEKDEYVSFNESAFLPSRFRFEVDHQTLYNFQIQNQGWDAFIKSILRSYGGAFESYVRLKEFDVSRRSGHSVQQVIEGLKQLEEYGLLNYFPQNDQPQITFIKPRQQQLYINKAYIEERKALYKQKMDAVLAYATHRRCRSQLLLGYFDEQAAKCGICDICIEEKRKSSASDILDEITNSIAQILSGAPIDLDTLVSSVKVGTEKDILSAIRILLDAGKIRFNGEKYYL